MHYCLVTILYLFLAMYLFQIPSLLVLELISGTPWLKIDFCIGKIVKEGGD